MKLARTAGLAAGLALCLSASAPAADVTLRVEGDADTVVPRLQLATPPDPVVKDGDPAHACSGASPAGALERAVGGDWSGRWFDGFGYSVERVRDETHAFTSDKYWSLWVNGRLSETGLCGPDLQNGDDVLLFPDCSVTGCANPLPLRLTAPASAAPGRPFRVTVTELAASGAAQPAAGATVSAAGRAFTTDAAGVAEVTAEGASVALRATKADRVRSSTESVCLTSGLDGRCGSGVDDAAPRVTVFTPRHDRRSYRRGPRQLRGAVGADASGIAHVKLRLTRSHRGRCWAYGSRRERFRRVPCGDGWYFSVGDRERWSYLLPKRLPAGRYLLKAVAVDGAGNRDAIRTGRNRVVFRVR